MFYSQLLATDFKTESRKTAYSSAIYNNTVQNLCTRCAYFGYFLYEFFAYTCSLSCIQNLVNNKFCVQPSISFGMTKYCIQILYSLSQKVFDKGIVENVLLKMKIIIELLKFDKTALIY